MSLYRLGRVSPCVVVLFSQGACSSNSEEGEANFKFGSSDMKAVAGGDWQGTLTLGGSATTYTLTLDYAAPSQPSSQPACTSRTLTGPACVTVSSMGFVGVLTSADSAFDGQAVSATFEVFGEELTNGQLMMKAGEHDLYASYGSGKFEGGNVSLKGNTVGSFTMSRP
ncbi:MAG: hypothetical protein KF718_12990 [Polyangiaceae bacterium]|nr:hypothetical protein [Polyangiaceae bacterium]